jgi:hypothetical protein
MENIVHLPEWLGTAVIGAVIAALGFVAKLVIQWILDLRNNNSTRRARLVELLSILDASHSAFKVQNRNRNNLSDSLPERFPLDTSIENGFDYQFTEAFSNMTPKELELHSIIRSYTMNTIKPLNDKALEWLQKDTYFKARNGKRDKSAELAKQLTKLEAHLYLWQAKYTIWIPDNPKHSLVYLADEKNHGIGFPDGIENDIRVLLKLEK